MIPSVMDRVRETLSLPRFLHSLRTAETAALLCKRFEDMYEVKKEEGFYTGIVHDIAREASDDELLVLAHKDTYPPVEMELEKPSLLHGKAAAVILSEEFEENDERILQAVRWHTYGHPDMGSLGLVLYIADYIEPGRPHIDEEYTRFIMSFSRLEDMGVYILEEEFAYLKGKGSRIADSSLMLYDFLLHNSMESV